MTDADLLREAQGGNAEAWRTLYQRYLPSVWRQAYAVVSDTHAAEDITSETMLALLRSIGRLNAGATSVAGWLRRVVHNKAMDHHRQSFRRRENLPRFAGNLDQCPGGASVSSLEVAETRAQVLTALEAMPERQRTMLQWKYVDNLGVREMAERLGETEKAVESTLYRARREFRRLIDAGQTGGAKVTYPCL